MNEIVKSMDEIFSKNEVVERHSFFQLQHFVIDMEPTVQGKLHACLRELKTRRLSLESMQLESQDLQDKQSLLVMDLEDLQVDINEWKKETVKKGTMEKADERQQKLYAINLGEIQRKILINERAYRELQRKMKYMLDECLFFITSFQQLLEEEDIKPWDDIEVQKEYWDVKISELLKMKLILGLPLDQELVKTALCLHDDSKAKKMTVNLIEEQQRFNKAHNLPSPEATMELPD